MLHKFFSDIGRAADSVVGHARHDKLSSRTAYFLTVLPPAKEQRRDEQRRDNEPVADVIIFVGWRNLEVCEKAIIHKVAEPKRRIRFYDSKKRRKNSTHGHNKLKTACVSSCVCSSRNCYKGMLDNDNARDSLVSFKERFLSLPKLQQDQFVQSLTNKDIKCIVVRNAQKTQGNKQTCGLS